MMYRVSKRTTKEKIRRLAADERGAILPLTVLFLVPILGFAFLMIDLSRFLNMQTQLQKAADAFAVAAAAELDGRPAVNGKGGAIDRANAAIDTLLQGMNESRWGTASKVQVASRRYLSALPALDSQPIGGGLETADPRQARFVEVVVQSVSMLPAISAAIVGANPTLSTTASAVAGYSQTVCKFTPLYICNPVEDQGISIWEAAADETFKRKELTLKVGPGADANCPGNFGYLSVGDNGAKALREALASPSPGVCYNQNGVDTKPGNVESASDAINIRLDLYRGSAKTFQNAAYPPAPNVRKGYYQDSKSACNQTAWDPNNAGCATGVSPDPFFGFPADANPAATTLCGGTIGDGNWDFERYWNANHTIVDAKTGIANVRDAPYGWSNAPDNLPSRQAVYKYEIEAGIDVDSSSGVVADPIKMPLCKTKDEIPGEVGNPVCNTPASADPNRRSVYGAIINCKANPIKGSTNNIPVEAFAKFFLTRPATDSTIYAELEAIVRPGDGTGVVHDNVQLYR